jgi:hypothetical protein
MHLAPFLRLVGTLRGQRLAGFDETTKFRKLARE